MPKTKKSKTHFEQVPLEIVKKIVIVEEEIPRDAEDGDDEADETPK